MARASAPPWDPTPSCRIAVVKAAISPSLSARSRRETHFRKTSPHLNGSNFLEVDLLLLMQDAVFWDVRCDFLRFRQRTDPLVILELLGVGSFSFFLNMSCVLWRNRHSSTKSPVAHFFVRIS